MSAGVKAAVRGDTDLISSAEVQATHSAEPDCISSGSSPMMKLSGSSLKRWGSFCEYCQAVLCISDFNFRYKCRFSFLTSAQLSWSELAFSGKGG